MEKITLIGYLVEKSKKKIQEEKGLSFGLLRRDRETNQSQVLNCR